jgi:hypothetical protein
VTTPFAFFFFQAKHRASLPGPHSVLSKGLSAACDTTFFQRGLLALIMRVKNWPRLYPSLTILELSSEELVAMSIFGGEPLRDASQGNMPHVLLDIRPCFNSYALLPPCTELGEAWVEHPDAALRREGDPDSLPFQTVVAPAHGALFEKDAAFFTSVFTAADSLAKVRPGAREPGLVVSFPGANLAIAFLVNLSELSTQGWKC